MINHKCVVLTGGPGGGKSTLIKELLADPAWSGRLAILPETISLMRHIGLSPKEKRFQRTMVHLQMALEDELQRVSDQNDSRMILCHRGSLDPLAYWLDRGWAVDEFFEVTGTTKEGHYQRYTAVIHLVTASVGASRYYTRFPQAHRPESAEDAIRLDSLLYQAWHSHPAYYRLDNLGKDWEAKSQAAREILAALVTK